MSPELRSKKIESYGDGHAALVKALKEFPNRDVAVAGPSRMLEHPRACGSHHRQRGQLIHSLSKIHR